MRGEDAAAEGGRGCADEVDTGGFCAGGGADAFAEEVVGVGPGAGVAVDVGGTKAEGDFDGIAAAEGERGAAEGHADAAGGGLHGGEVGGDVLDGLDVDVDGLDLGAGCGGAVVDVPLTGLELRLGRALGLGGEGADADDRAADVAAEAVGGALERLLLGDGRLDLRAPATESDPESVGREDGEAEGLAQAEDGER